MGVQIIPPVFLSLWADELAGLVPDEDTPSWTVCPEHGDECPLDWS